MPEHDPDGLRKTWLAWLAAVREWLDQEVRAHPKLVVLGESHALPGDAGQRTPIPGSDAVSPW